MLFFHEDCLQPIIGCKRKTGFAACLLLNGSSLILRKIKMTTDWTAQIYPVSVLLQLALIQLLALPVSSV